MALAQHIFREYDIRGVTGKDLTPDVARLVARGYAAFLTQQGVKGEIAVGRDNRPSGNDLHRELVAGLLESGLDVVDIGIVPTPLAYWAQHNLNVAGGIQITGSHNPPEFNGFKLGIGTRSIYGKDIQQIYQIALAGKFPSGEGKLRQQAIIDRYVDDVGERIGKISRDINCVVDCGNGAGALVARQLFERIGLSPEILFGESDGTFPNHHPDPTVPENLKDLIGAVKERGAQLGIAFDGDADRIGLVDEDGSIIWGDQLLIIYARDVLARTGKGQPIIFDVKCSQALPDEIARAGGKPIMWKTGHSLIKQKMKETGALLAGELSGHIMVADDYYGFDDALYDACRLVSLVSRSERTLSEMVAGFPVYVSTPEIRIDVSEEQKWSIVEQAVAHFKKGHDVIDVDGARVLFGDGWALMRASNTQPAIVARFEAKSARRLAEIQQEVGAWLATHGVSLP